MRGHVAIELARTLEDSCVPRRQPLDPGLVTVGGEPPGLARNQTFRRSAVRAVARANDVVDEVTFVVRQHEATLGAPRRVALHHVVMMETYDLARATDLVGQLAVPERHQHVAV